jgi:precorrin-2/cobalt-factor-2 C20-methyltransferase
VVSGAKGPAKLREVIDKTDTVVLLKTYRHADDILAALEELSLTDQAVCISRVGLEGETVVQDVRELKGQPLPYFSMIIIRREGGGLR